MPRTCQTVRTVPSLSGFSLIEVVVAVAIFAIGMVSVVGLFAPIARSVSASSDAEAAARVAEAVRTRLQSMPYADVLALLKASNSRGHDVTDLDARIDYDLTRDPQLLFANRDGSKVGLYGDAIWLNPTTRRNWDGEKFFEVALIRNEAISPKTSTTTAADGTTTTTIPDESAPMIAYSARVRWPAFFADTATTAVQVGSNPNATVRFDHSKKQVLFFAGSITR